MPSVFTLCGSGDTFLFNDSTSVSFFFLFLVKDPSFLMHPRKKLSNSKDYFTFFRASSQKGEKRKRPPCKSSFSK